MSFDDTLTDEEFRRALLDSQGGWLASAPRAEPDLRVEGLSGSLLARLVALFSASPSDRGAE